MMVIRYLITLLSVFAALPSAAGDKIRIVYFSYPPNLIIDTIKTSRDKPKGAIVQVWEKYIAPRADISLNWIGPYPFSRAMSMLESGEADTIQHLSRTPERESKFIFSKNPIMWGRQGILVRKNDTTGYIKNVADLQNKKIGMIGEGYLAPFLSNNRNEIMLEEVYGIDAGQKIVRMLLSERIWGAYFTFPDVLLYYAAIDKKLNDVKVIGFPGSDKNEVIYTAFSKKLDVKIIKRIDDAITAVYRQYDYPKMVQSVFNELNKQK